MLKIIQEFETAKTRVQPFTLRLKYRDMNEHQNLKEIIKNKKTNEVLSIEPHRGHDRAYGMLEVKRTFDKK